MIKVGFVIALLGFLGFCVDADMVLRNQTAKIRVINHTDESFTHVSLFSMKFQDLAPADTSAYQNLDFDPLRDDPLIYCSVGDNNYARYLEIPAEGMKKFSYILDSVQNGILYVSMVHEN